MKENILIDKSIASAARIIKLIKCLSSKDINEAMKANKSSENVQKFML